MPTKLNRTKAEENFEAACVEENWRPSDNDGSCSCHTNPPCSWCVNDDYMEGFDEWCEENNIIIEESGMGHEYSGDNSRLLKLIGDVQFIEIENAIASLYQWYLENKKHINKAELSFNSTKK